MNDQKTPERAGIWERFDSGAQPGKSTPPRGWFPPEPDAAQNHRSYLLLAFTALGGLLILLSLPGSFEDSNADPWLLSTRVIAAFFQVFLFALLLFLSIQAPGGYRRLMWLSLFFAGSLLHALQHLGADPLRQYLYHLSLATWSPALIGYGSTLLWRQRTRRHGFEWSALGLWLLLLVVLTFCYAQGTPTPPTLVLALWILAALPFGIYLMAALASRLSIRAAAPRDRPVRIILLLLLGLYALFLFDALEWLHRPGPWSSPLFLPLLASLVFYYAVQNFTDALRSVAFYGRFIRPGLKDLLESQGHDLLGDEKLFRGRKTVILKLDMANFTRTTFTMPYGMRRLFLDLWFTLLDQVVAGKVFLDKSLGDGSVYCFEDGLPGGSCRVALETALEIRERQVGRFDQTYREGLDRLLERTPELVPRAEQYFEAYRQRHGEDFAERRTQIRIALVTGFVDEGLWGLTSQSHYDVQGEPLVLAARIEAQAQNGEIVFDEDFLRELQEEAPGWLDTSRLEERTLELKGVGSRKIYALPAGDPDTDSSGVREKPTGPGNKS